MYIFKQIFMHNLFIFTFIPTNFVNVSILFNIFTGLIALNSLAAICSLTGIATWVAQFSVRLKTNVLIREDTIKGGWSSEGLSFLGHSFWFVVVGAGLFIINIIIFFILKSKRKKRDPLRRQVMESSKPNGNLMLY
uniref:Uncharacterized protein n=1 Tax=Lepeophtheirus salmonis TaxID=72036 RepID=A0A0K2SYF1_LEPSM